MLASEPMWRHWPWRRRSLVPAGRTSGRPTSSNGASSTHAWWEAAGRFREVAVTLEVIVPPAVPSLYFWAVQTSFVAEGGAVLGAAHLGLQAHSGHPGGTAVNWGGYRAASAGGGELKGTPSDLPSATGNVNTRDFSWSPGVAYRLEVMPGLEPGWWAGRVTNLATGSTTLVRELHAPGSAALGSPVVWSEVFARCDAPSTTVRWLGFEPRPAAVRVTYQSVDDGGCSNSNTSVRDGGVLQTTATTRTVSHGSRLPLT